MGIVHLLEKLVETKGSDLHLCVGTAPQIRVHGDLVPVGEQPLDKETCEKLIAETLDEKNSEILQRTRELDFSFGISGLGRFRVNVFWQRDSMAAAFRIIPVKIPGFGELGLPEKTMKRFADLPNGMVLLTGPTGSGKSTTLAAMVDYINETRAVHIISIEDPVEYLHKHKKAMIAQREVGTDTLSFAESLKRILREDPDVVLIGEMRDLETIAAALTVAETGHLVLSTLHTSDAANAIARMVDVFPEEQQQQIRTQISLTLCGVIVQQLVPTIESDGRCLALEIMTVTPAIRNLIREQKLEQIYSLIQMGSDLGMVTMNASLGELYRQGKISVDMALHKSGNQKEMMRLIEMAGMAQVAAHG